MAKLGFCSKWRHWIMQCVKTITFSVIVNGRPGDIFSPTRSIRQGDPLSLYLFILCAKGFTMLLNNADATGKTKGVWLRKVEPESII